LDYGIRLRLGWHKILYKLEEMLNENYKEITEDGYVRVRSSQRCYTDKTDE
jgi:hypothetical protein